MTDKWSVTDFLTINNRFAYTYRDIDAMRNGDSTRTTVCTNPATQKDPVTNRPQATEVLKTLPTLED